MTESLFSRSFFYLAEGLVFCTLAFFLVMFYRGFGRRYVKHWASSTFFLALSFLAASYAGFSAEQEDTASIQIVLTTITKTTMYLAVAFLMLGTYLACNTRPLARKTIIVIVSTTFILGLFTALMCAFDANDVFHRYYMRESLQSFVLGCAFLGAALFLITGAIDHFSLRIFAVVFSITSIRYLTYSFASIAIPTNELFQYISDSLPYLDMGLMLVISFGMLFWIHGAERADAATAINQAKYLGAFDALTGAMKRDEIIEKLPEVMGQVKERENTLAIITLDLRRFKFINDSYGLKVGDYVLEEVATRLSQSIIKPHLVGRLSGDSFAVIVELHSVDDEIEYTLAHIHSLVERPYQYQSDHIRLGCSIGYTLYPEHGDNAEELLRKANRALFQAETNNLGSVCYQAGMQDEGRRLLGLEQSIRDAFKNKEFIMYFQPQLNLHSNRLEGVEALIRWQHPDKGLLSPAEFLPEIEALGLNAELDEYVLNYIAETAQQWFSKYRKRVTIAVNLTVAQFQDPKLVHNIQHLLLSHHLLPENIELEVTENTAMTDIEIGMQTISALQNMGVKVSIDDFGTGHASLAYLRDLPIDKVKIDRSFVVNMTENDADMTIVKSMIKLAHGLGKRVLAEGVETEAQMSLLKTMGCDAIQGYYIARPLPAEELEKHLVRK